MRVNWNMRTLFFLGVTTSLTACQMESEKTSGAGNLGILNVGYEQITACVGNPTTPTRAFVVTLENPTDLFAVKRNIIETQANASATDIEPGQPTTLAYPAGAAIEYPPGSAPTPLDFWLKLQPTPASKRDTVLIKFVLSDDRMRFRSDGFAVAGDSKGKDMFCKLVVAADKRSATVWGRFHHKPHPGSSKTFGSYNLGVELMQNGGVYLPIFIDPMVKNEG